jgi:hypothetical protein
MRVRIAVWTALRGHRASARRCWIGRVEGGAVIRQGWDGTDERGTGVRQGLDGTDERGTGMRQGWDGTRLRWIDTRQRWPGACQHWTILLCIGAASWGQSSLTLAQDSPANVLDQMRSCVTEKNDTRRLACFDEHMRGQSSGRAASAAWATSAPSVSSASASGVSTSAAPASAVASASAPGPASAAASASRPSSSVMATQAASAATPATAALTPEQQFGMNGALERRQQVQADSKAPPPLKKLSAHIKSVSYRPQGEAVVTLDNGEIWEEAELSSHLELRPGDEVTVKRGLLGSFWLYTSTVPAQRVTRRQ